MEGSSSGPSQRPAASATHYGTEVSLDKIEEAALAQSAVVKAREADNEADAVAFDSRLSKARQRGPWHGRVRSVTLFGLAPLCLVTALVYGWAYLYMYWSTTKGTSSHGCSHTLRKHLAIVAAGVACAFWIATSLAWIAVRVLRNELAAALAAAAGVDDAVVARGLAGAFGGAAPPTGAAGAGAAGSAEEGGALLRPPAGDSAPPAAGAAAAAAAACAAAAAATAAAQDEDGQSSASSALPARRASHLHHRRAAPALLCDEAGCCGGCEAVLPRCCVPSPSRRVLIWRWLCLFVPCAFAVALLYIFVYLVIEAHAVAAHCPKFDTDPPSSAVDNPATPNVLVVMVDDLRYDGPWMANAPNMQALITKGHTFENSYCTWSVCGPSRTSILTGMRPMTIGFTANHGLELHGKWSLDSYPSLPQTFSADGRYTASVGKVNHNQYAWGEFDYDARPVTSPYCWNSDVLWCEYSWWKPYQNDAAVADAAIEVLDKVDSNGAAFLMMVGFHKPHVPWPILPEDWDANAHVFEGVSADMRVHPRYARVPDNNGLPGLGGIGRVPGSSKWWRLWGRRLMDYNDAGPPWSLRSDYKTMILRRAYASSITRTDAEVGRVLAAAAKRDWYADNTVVVFMADHGFALGESGKTGKHDLLDVQMRVPLSIVLPPHVAGAIHHASRTPRRFVSLLDVYPTLARLANITADRVPRQLEGTDLYAPHGEVGISLNFSDAAIASAAATGAKLPRRLSQAVYPVIDHGDGRALAVEGFRYVAWEREREGKGDGGDGGVWAHGDDGDDPEQPSEELYRFDLELYHDPEYSKHHSANGSGSGSGAGVDDAADDDDDATMTTRGVNDGRHAIYAEFESVAPSEPELAAALHEVLRQMLISPSTARAGLGAFNESFNRASAAVRDVAEYPGDGSPNTDYGANR